MSSWPDKQPVVSIIIPTYNRARIVVNAVESALAQSYPRCEVIVVDDGSTDGTREALARYAGRITYLYQKNKERSAARNNGLRHASGQYVVFLDADDVLLPEMVSVQTEYLERHPQAAFVHAYALMADAEGRVLKPQVLIGAPLDPSRPAFASLIMGTPVLPSSALARWELVQAVGGFDETLSVGEDWDLWLKLAVRGEVGFTHQPVAVYAVEAAYSPDKLDGYNVQDNIPRMIERAFTYLPPGSLLIELKPRALARAHIQWGACVEHALGRTDRAQFHIRQALSADPALAADVEVVPKGVARFATWHQQDGAAFIRSFFRQLSPSSEWKKLERSTLVLYHSKMGHTAATQRRYGKAASHALRAAFAEPSALAWAGRQFVRRLWHRAFGR